MSIVVKFPLEKVSRTSSLSYEKRHLSKVLLFEGVHYSSQMECNSKAETLEAPEVSTTPTTVCEK